MFTGTMLRIAPDDEAPDRDHDVDGAQAEGVGARRVGAAGEGKQPKRAGQDVDDIVPAVHVEDPEYGVDIPGVSEIGRVEEPDDSGDHEHPVDEDDRASDPLDEQVFLVDTINRLQRLPDWRSIAIVIAYDDPGGWYDHVFPPITNRSNDPRYDALLGPELCGQPSPAAYLDRCGNGLRPPLLVISPFVRPNSVSHQVLEQASILSYIEDNWGLGRIGDQSFDATAGPFSSMFDFSARPHAKPLFLDPATGEKTHPSPAVRTKGRPPA